MQSDKRPRLLTAAAGAALGGLALWLALRFLVPWTLPFLIALALSALLEGPVGFLSARLSLPRWAAAAGCTLLLVLLLSGALLLALWRLWYEASLLLEELPPADRLPALPGDQAEDWAYAISSPPRRTFRTFCGRPWSPCWTGPPPCPPCSTTGPPRGRPASWPPCPSGGSSSSPPPWPPTSPPPGGPPSWPSSGGRCRPGGDPGSAPGWSACGGPCGAGSWPRGP